MGWLRNTAQGSNPKRLRRSLAYLAGRRERHPPPRPSVPEPPPDLDLCVVSCNSAKSIAPFVDSLLKQDYPAEHLALLVRDNASSDDSVARWKKQQRACGSRFRRFDVLQGPNVGFGNGHNALAERVTTPFFLVSNVDLEFERQSIVAAMSRAWNEEAAVASWEFRQKPCEHPHYYDPVSLETAWSPHACILFRTTAFRAVGGYEPRLFLYGEDAELSYRLRDRGYLLRYCPHAAVWHDSSRPSSEFNTALFFRGALANALLRLRYGRPGDLGVLPFLWAHRRRVSRRLPGGRRQCAAVTREFLRLAPGFLRTRRVSRLVFPLHLDGYELRREGAGHALPRSLPGRLRVTPVLPGGNAAALVHQTYRGLRRSDTRGDGPAGAPSLGARLRHALDDPATRLVAVVDERALLFADHVETLVADLASAPAADAAQAAAWTWREDARGSVRSLPRRMETPHASLLIRRRLCRRLIGETADPALDGAVFARLVHARTEVRHVPKTTSIVRAQT